MAKSYTHIDNNILEGLSRLRLSGSTFNVLMAIIRYTLSFHRNQHELSNGFLMNATGLNERSVIRAIRELEQRGIIKIISENRGSHPKKIRVYTDKIVTLTNPQGGTDKNVSDSTDKTVSENTDKNVSQENKKETKETKKKERNLSLSELAAISQAEEIEEEDGYEYL